MNLLLYYSELFTRASREFEPDWTLDPAFTRGYRWMKTGHTNIEIFQIEDWNREPPVLMYAYILPNTYNQTTLPDEAKRYNSQYELAVHSIDEKVWLSAALSVEKLQESVMGFVNGARSELLDILDFTIMKS